MANEFKVKKGLIVTGSGSTIFDVQGSAGQLFSVTDSLTGVLFSVNDISGIPVLTVSSDDTINMGTYGAEGLKVSGSSIFLPYVSADTTSSVTALVKDSSNKIVTRTLGTGAFSNIGGGTTNYVPKFTGTTALGNSLIYDNGTNVGIGTTSPIDSKLVVEGSVAGDFQGIAITNTNNNTNNLSSLYFGTYSASVTAKISARNRNDISAASSELAFFTRGTTSVLTERMTIQPNGNVGIGTTSPNAALHISGNTIVQGNLYVTGGTQSLFSGNSSVEMVKIIQNGSGDAFVVEDIANGDSSHFVINASGNTAIGLTQPLGSDKLTVSGDTSIYGLFSATSIITNSLSATSNVFIGVTGATIPDVRLHSKSTGSTNSNVTFFTDNFARATVTPGGTPSITYNTIGNSVITVLGVNPNALGLTQASTYNVLNAGYPAFPITNYNTQLNANGSTLQWAVNTRQTLNASMSGFSAGQAGQAVVLACSNANPGSSGANGYALVYGNLGTNQWSLAYFTNGLNNNSNITNLISAPNVGGDTKCYYSLRVTYNTVTNVWSLYHRNDGCVAATTPWGDPLTVSTLIGTATNTTYVSTPLPYFSFVYNATGGNGYFDNFSLLNLSATTFSDSVRVEDGNFRQINAHTVLQNLLTLNATNDAAAVSLDVPLYGLYRDGNHVKIRTGIGATDTTLFTGGTVTGATIFTGGLSANTFSATTVIANNFTGLASLATSATTALNATNATKIFTANLPTTDVVVYPTFVNGYGNNRDLYVDSNTLTYNPSSNILTLVNLVASGGITANTISASSISNIAGLSNYVAKFTSNGTFLGNSTIFDNGTSVGIGNTSPSATAKLDVTGIIRSVLPDPTGIGGITAKLLSYAPSPYGLIFTAYPTGEYAIQNQREANDSQTYPLLLQPNGGNVGIGTTATLYYTLQVSGTTYISGELRTGTDANINYITVGRGSGGQSYNTALGYKSLLYNTTGDGNTALGAQPLSSNLTGNNNTAVGFNSLATNITGSSNTAIGYESLRFNTVSGNTAVGFQSLSANTTGYNNVAMGYKTLSKNTIGYSNTGMGYLTLSALTTGNKNTAIGDGALVKNEIGNRNTAIGFQSLYYNTGDGNIAIGVQSLYNNISGTYNVGIGHGALSSNTTADGNIGIGASAAANTTGSGNIAIGLGALFTNTTSTNNTAIGYQSAYNNYGADNTSIGYQSLFNNTSGVNNVSIGGSSLLANTSGMDNVAIGYHALLVNTDTNSNIGVGAYALVNSTGGNNLGLGVEAGGNITSGNNNIFIGSSNYNNPDDGGQNVGNTLSISKNSANHLGYPQIWSPEDQISPIGTTVAVLTIEPSIYSGLFIEYTLDNGQGDMRAGKITAVFKPDMSKIDWLEDSIVKFGTVNIWTFDVIDNGSGKIDVTLANASGSDDVHMNYTSRLILRYQ